MKDTVQQFAVHHHLRTRRDECRDQIVPGRNGDIFDFSDGRLGVCLMFDTRRAWTFAKRKLIAAGFVLTQDGDTEGVATFRPEDPKHSRLAIKVTGARAKRILSPAQRAARIVRLEKARTARTAPGVATRAA